MDHIVLTKGIVLKQTAFGDFDRRLEILTVDRGRITAFAKGARRQGNRLSAATDYFCFGDFKLYPGREAYSLTEANISEYFSELRNDFEACMYGMYFLEVAQFNTRENVQDKDILKTLYLALKNLTIGLHEHKFVKTVYEIKIMALMGEFKRVEEGYMPLTIYAQDYIIKAKPEQVFAFQLAEEAMRELKQIAEKEKARCWQHHFKSEEMILG